MFSNTNNSALLHPCKVKLTKGFTLIELILVIVILGVMAVGITGFIRLTTQTYLNVSERTELLANARFAVERFNRELRNAVPNSIRINEDSSTECIEFVPIKASSTYIDIPVVPELAQSELTVIPFQGLDGNPYQCSSPCADTLSVYPLRSDDIYVNHDQVIAATFPLLSINIISANTWQLVLNSSTDIHFSADSPTERIYIFSGPVSYCLRDDKLYRVEGYPLSNNNYVMPNSDPILMAEYLVPSAVGSSFDFSPATLQRNGIVEIQLSFEQNGEVNVFNNEIHINNVP